MKMTQISLEESAVMKEIITPEMTQKHFYRSAQLAFMFILKLL